MCFVRGYFIEDLAHRNQDDGREQLLIAHLRGVNERAGEFAEVFSEQEAGEHSVLMDGENTKGDMTHLNIVRRNKGI